MHIESHQGNKADSFRVSWCLLKSAPSSCVEAIGGEAKRMDSVQPTVTSCGITSDPIRECSNDSQMAAVQFSIKEPWREIAVYQNDCDVQDCNGYVQRKMELTSTGDKRP